MPESSSGSGFTYRAFISYSHRDKAWGDWLHKALETYRVPSRLVGKQTEAGIIPRSLHPVFRDREELSSSPELGSRINEALGKSENLVVICSPASAISRWVNEEVLAYKRMGRGDRIFCLIVGGEPDASDIPGREAEECFCPALRFKLDASGQPTSERTEPIAADARPGKDGKPNAKLKLIAGMLGVGFDALKQRDLQRRTRRMTAIAALALVVMAGTSALAIYALISRHRAVIAQHEAVVAQRAAKRRQKQAENLVGFMLGDLNDKLNQVHRLDIMQAVDEKALTYFASLPSADATDAALGLRVKALDKIGLVMTEAHGQLGAAAKAYESAAQLAAEMARREPHDTGRQAAWANSLNMVGVAYWQQGDLDNALKYWRRTSSLLEKAHVAEPEDTKITSSLAGIRNNIGHVLESRGDFAGAQTEYDASLRLYQALAAGEPHNAEHQSNVAWSWDNLGKLAVERGQLGGALKDYVAEHRIKATLAARNAGDHSATEDLLVSNAILGRSVAWCGETEAGLRYTNQALAQVKALLGFDASSTGWQEYSAIYSQQAGGLLRQLGRPDNARSTDGRAVKLLEVLLKKDPISSDFQQDLSQAQLEMARLQLAQGDRAAADGSAQSASGMIRKLRIKAPDDRALLLLDAQARLLFGQITAQLGNTVAAQRDWTQARELLEPALRAGNDPNFLAAYVEALLRLDKVKSARPVIAQLNMMGYRTPDFVALLAEKHIAYPINTAFQRRIATILHSSPTLATDPASPPATVAGDGHP